MADTVLITGPPRSGKTTVIDTVRTDLEAAGFAVGGLVCPERRHEGERVGFDVVDVATGDRATLAHVDQEEGPRVGTYRVAVDNLERIASKAFATARETSDVVIIDEIAPMELHSEAFVDGVEAVLAAPVPVVAAIHQRSDAGLIGRVKARDDVEKYCVTAENRDDLPQRVIRQIAHHLNGGVGGQ